VGDVSGSIFGPDVARRFVSAAGVVGSRQQAPLRTRVEQHRLEAGQVLVLFTDGIKSRVDLSSELALLRQRPYSIAEQVIDRWSRGHDDATVVVVR
jgi:serine/threonine protein phosphatase PrpC